jgi:hypothetical protein
MAMKGFWETNYPSCRRVRWKQEDLSVTITLDLPPNVEQAYIAAAQARGVPLDAFVREVVIAAKPGNIPGAKLPAQTVFEQGLGLFGNQEDAALLDEVVSIAYEERRRPTAPSSVL